MVWTRQIMGGAVTLWSGKRGCGTVALDLPISRGNKTRSAEFWAAIHQSDQADSRQERPGNDIEGGPAEGPVKTLADN